MSEKEWFYLKAGNTQLGPLTSDELVSLVTTGEIEESTRVWKDSMRDWVPFSKTELCSRSDLVQKAAKSDIRQCPYCRSEIQMAALICKTCKKRVPPIVDSHTEIATQAEPINIRLPLVLYSVLIGLYVILALAFTNIFDYTISEILRIFTPVAILVVAILTVVFGSRLHYFCWKAVPENKRPFTPQRAVGFLFIPAYNLYWVFESFPKLAKCLNESAPQYPKKASFGLGLTLAILFVVSFLFNAAGSQNDDYYALVFLIMIAEYVIWLLFYRTVVEIADSVRENGGA